MESNTAKASIGTVLAGGLGVAVYAVTLQAGSHTDGRIVLATGNTHYQQLAETYRPELERYGVRLEFRDMEGFATLKALVDDKSEINAGFVKGGLVGSMQGRLPPRRPRGGTSSMPSCNRSAGCSTSRSGCSRAPIRRCKPQGPQR